MMQNILAILARIRCLGVRSVVLVPESVYLKALLGLACLYPNNAGRTARMPCGNFVSIVSTSTDIGEVTGDFDLFLCGWGEATQQEGKTLNLWVSKARGTHAEVS